ncbi:hypothetical protein FGO68_gene15063 [Halteria grandinella]|uniref:Uncharacterized protein n=1 Tax=Halteria grandinella TaxID=5974 RepID=A0A8J8T3E0_HALGN|nr:hypothetical protein FGO68_gene15063 [Halteria grandinella]
MHNQLIVPLVINSIGNLVNYVYKQDNQTTLTRLQSNYKFFLYLNINQLILHQPSNSQIIYILSKKYIIQLLRMLFLKKSRTSKIAEIRLLSEISASDGDRLAERGHFIRHNAQKLLKSQFTLKGYNRIIWMYLI